MDGLLDIVEKVVKVSLSENIELMAHFASGYLATELFMPKVEGLRKYVYSGVAAFLPDVDLLSSEAAYHGGLTHTVPGALVLSSCVPGYTNEREDGLARNIYSWAYDKLSSPEFLALSFGCLLHLGVDVAESDLARFAYSGLTLVATRALRNKRDRENVFS